MIAESEVAIVDFTASWCQPCKALNPILENLAAETSYSFYKVDIDDVEVLVKEYKVMSVPTVIVFKNGQFHKRFSGLTSKENLMKLVE